MTLLREAFKLSGGGIISLVGAGGKSSLMMALADEFSSRGQSVLITTTTKILKPGSDLHQAVIIEKDPQRLISKCRDAAQEHAFVTAAAGSSKIREKLVGFRSEVIEAVWRSGLFEWIVVEADGAKRKPIKAPADHEPVIPGESGWVVGLVGLTGIGKPFSDQWVFRPEQFQRITGLRRGDTVSPAAIAAILSDSRGLMKGAPAKARKMVFLNQADTADRIAYAKQVVALLEKEPCAIERVVFGRLKPAPHIIDTIDLSG